VNQGRAARAAAAGPGPSWWRERGIDSTLAAPRVTPAGHRVWAVSTTRAALRIRVTVDEEMRRDR